MIGIGTKAPDFLLEGALAGSTKEYSLSSFPGRWLVIFFYPADFTFICPTEILGFQSRHAEFQARGCAVLGISLDDADTHLRWAKELGGLSYPLLSDSGGRVSRNYGVFDETDNVAQRATFIFNPDRTVLFAMVTSMNVGRSVAETLRVVIALQSGKLCPAEWTTGEETGELSLKY